MRPKIQCAGFVSRGIPKLQSISGERHRLEMQDLSDYYGDVTGDDGDQVQGFISGGPAAFVLCGFY